LRLSALAAEALADPGQLERFRAFLRAHDLYVFAITGFPYGPFHGVRVKEEVYLPDWLDPARLAYTDRLARLLADLLPAEPGLEGSVSTVPGAFKARVRDEADAARMGDLIVEHAATLHGIRERTGKSISLALEPEPFCHMETVAETVSFFEKHLFSAAAVKRLAALTGLDGAASEALLLHHVGVCFDACHMAVEFEEPEAALRALRGAGIRIAKVQISAGLRVHLGGRDDVTDLPPPRPGLEPADRLDERARRDRAGRRPAGARHPGRVARRALPVLRGRDVPERRLRPEDRRARAPRASHPVGPHQRP